MKASKNVLCVMLAALVGAAMISSCRSVSTQPETRGAAAPVHSSPLARKYTEGETIRYIMSGTNQGRQGTLHYEAEAESKVVRDGRDCFVEEIRWTRLTFANRDVPLDEASLAFRQRLSLDPRYEMSPPDITGINPMLFGPVFDLMTFYVDLHPSLHQHKLNAIGDSVHVAHGRPNSWADGVNVILGEDCIDFALKLEALDAQRAALRVRHIPPKASSVKFPAEWMQERVKPGVPNNWVQVQRAPAQAADASGPKFIAAAGHEVFDVLITIDRSTGSILSATMDNPVDVIQRHCADESLNMCGDPVKFQIRRSIELRRMSP